MSIPVSVRKEDLGNIRNNTAATEVRPRIKRLRERHLEIQQTASIDRLRIETREMIQSEGEPMIIRRAKVFAAISKGMPITIGEDELIVGHAGIRPLCRDVITEDCPALVAGKRLAPLLMDTVEYGLKDFPESDQKEFLEEIVPYWRGNGDWIRTQTGYSYSKVPDRLKELLFIDRAVFPPKQSLIYTPFFGAENHYGHNSVNYRKVLEKGFLGIKNDAEIALAKIEDKDQNKKQFLTAVIIAMDAASQIGCRYARLARELSVKEKNAKRKNELLKIAEICERVPAHPAKTFQEALQSLCLTQAILSWEAPRIISQTPGRIDQYLCKYLLDDTERNGLTEEDAQELIECYLIKLNHVNRATHVALGGYREDGRDGTNEITYMLIEGMKHVRLAEPYLSLLVHARTSEKLLQKAGELCSLGMGHPVYLNADVLTTQMLARGSMGGPPVTLALARTATPVGCYEPVISGMDAGYSFGGYVNLAAILELVLTNGSSRHYKKKIGLDTGDPAKFSTFDDLKNAYRKQLDFMLKNYTETSNILEKTLADLVPTPFESALIEDCIANGISREEGGARYNFNPLIVGAGSTDAGDSLIAIRKLVFDEKKVSMKELCEALEANFEGYEALHRKLKEMPKFGNDRDEADEQVAWVSHVFAEEASKQKNTRGGFAVPMGGPLQYYMFGGWVVGALPSGRTDGTPLSDAWSPCAGCDTEGPTAVLNSMGKINNAELLGGVTLNMRFDPAFFQQRGGLKRFNDFIRAFVDQNILQVQFNMLNTRTLKNAQQEPENYRDLVVKVAGYSAYFTRLMKPLQDGIIARNEHRL
ncbi:MAG: hypothetical protein M0P57_03615 [Syntrophales bacterium]|jgi:formate C-acetyltransferase|nr:hypothetical protein [Syntrophales bacterium]MDY0044585.1 pyruvate formate lyase family protein [Syntrophales bacterium]